MPTAPAKRKQQHPAAVDIFPYGSLLDIQRLSVTEINSLLAEAREMDTARANKEARRKLGNQFSGKRVALLFYEASTRTRVSFEYASKTLGAMTTIVSAAYSSIEKGESLLDTGYTLKALGTDVIVMRHPSSGAPHLLAQHLGAPVINAGDGMHEHPTQALLDAYTILRHRSSLKGLRMALVGDIFHSRVARSNIHLLSKFSAKIVLCGPSALLPEVAMTLAPGLSIERDFNKALRGADVVMLLRVQKERLAGLNLDPQEYVRDYQLTSERLQKAKPGALVMHPGPMVRGMEVTAEVADGVRSLIIEQVANGVPVRMAVLARALRGKP
ncbi:MAG TPA: aspartate carbamoyltransferase catalytic subunit [Terriglobales bacterium]|nr:aspartate carbamoyltransferase catalytic subunit [Terriglobales bacterium]